MAPNNLLIFNFAICHMHAVFKKLEQFCIFDLHFTLCNHYSFRFLCSFVKYYFYWLLNLPLLHKFLSLSYNKYLCAYSFLILLGYFLRINLLVGFSGPNGMDLLTVFFYVVSICELPV